MDEPLTLTAPPAASLPGDPAAGLYGEKHPGYFGVARLELLKMLPPDPDRRLLEIGAGDGATLGAAKQLGLAGFTMGVDLVAPPAESLGRHAVDRFVAGNVESLELSDPADPFDALLCADVLEHLVDPWRTLRRLVQRLKPGGLVLSSIPNFRHQRALRPILFHGDFRYADFGLLDRTHLRFFCRRNIVDLHQQVGLQILRLHPHRGAYGVKHKLVNALTFGRLREFFVVQYWTLAEKPAPSDSPRR